MAGDWIKVECATPDKPEIAAVAELTGLDHDAVLGKLVRLWIWADQQTTDGNAPQATRGLLDRIAFHPGFTEAMEKVGWIQWEGNNAVFPHFDRHNGQSAKRRAASQKRVAKHRNSGNASGNASVTQEYASIPRPVRREIHERDNFSCAYCGRKEGEYVVGETARDAILSVDHVIPQSRGGDSSPRNLVTCCLSCNNHKSDRTPDECGLPWPVDRYGNRYGIVTKALLKRNKKRNQRREEKSSEKTPLGFSQNLSDIDSGEPSVPDGRPPSGGAVAGQAQPKIGDKLPKLREPQLSDPEFMARCVVPCLAGPGQPPDVVGKYLGLAAWVAQDAKWQDLAKATRFESFAREKRWGEVPQEFIDRGIEAARSLVGNGVGRE